MPNTGHRKIGRKYLSMIVMTIFNAAALIGFKADIEPVVIIDSIWAVWLLVEFVLDAVKK